MKYRFMTKWCILILSISFNLQFIQCFADNSRSKKTIQSVNLQTISDYVDNVDDDSEQNNSLDDYEDIDVVKKHISSDNNKTKGDNDDVSLLDTQERNNKFVRQAADFELAKFELKKVEKNVEHEILNLEKLYKTTKVGVKRQLNKDRMARIHVGEHKNHNKLIGDYSNFNQRKNQSPLSQAITSSDDTNNNQFSNMSKQLMKQKVETPLTNNETENDEMKKIETAIQKKIDAIKIKVNRQIAREQENKIIKRNNARYDDLQRLNSVEIQSPNLNKSIKSSTNSGSSLGNKNNDKRSTPIGINHYERNKIKKSIRRPEKSIISIKNESDDLERQLQLTPLTSTGSGNRFTRRLRKPPGVSKNLHRSSRRLRKPPGIKLTSLKNTPDNHNIKTRQVIKTQMTTKNSNFLFHNKLHRKRAALSNHVEQLALLKKKLKRTLEQNDERLKMNYLVNGGKLGQRTKRIADNLLDERNLNSVADSNGFDNVNDSQDINSQLKSEFKEVFGGYPSESDDTSLAHHKRIKRS